MDDKDAAWYNIAKGNRQMLSQAREPLWVQLGMALWNMVPHRIYQEMDNRKVVYTLASLH